MVRDSICWKQCLRKEGIYGLWCMFFDSSPVYWYAGKLRFGKFYACIPVATGQDCIYELEHLMKEQK